VCCWTGKKVRVLGREKKCVLLAGKKSACWYKSARLVEHVPFARSGSPNSACPPSPGLLPHNLQYPCEVIMSQRYICQCSKCQGGSKGITKRTIEVHLQQDRHFLQSLPSDADSALFVKSCINQTTQLLSQLHRGPRWLDTVSDVEGSHPEDSEGVFLSFLTPLTCAYFNYVNDPVHIHSEVSGQPDHYQGEAVWPG
jgi:hypothetical protein